MNFSIKNINNERPAPKRHEGSIGLGLLSLWTLSLSHSFDLAASLIRVNKFNSLDEDAFIEMHMALRRGTNQIILKQKC